MKRRALLAALLWLGLAPAGAQTCGERGVAVQVLGSGGPVLGEGRAAAGHLVWVDGRARVLVDVGSGSALRFGQSDAAFADLDALLLSQLQADHAGDLPALVEASRHMPVRDRPLPIFGPAGSKATPSTITFVRTLFDPIRGAYRHLSEFISPTQKSAYKLRPRDVSEKERSGTSVFANERVQVFAVPLPRPLPALAWRVAAGSKAIVFAGEAREPEAALLALARGADVLVAHAPPVFDASGAGAAARLARQAKAGRLVFMHRALLSQAEEATLRATLAKTYAGPIDFANDLDCFRP